MLSSRGWPRRTPRSDGTSTSSSPVWSVTLPASWRNSRAGPSRPPKRRRLNHERRPENPLSGDGAGEPRSAVGLDALVPDRHAEATAGRRSVCGRDAVAVRGADRARGAGDPPRAGAGDRELRRGADLPPRARGLQLGPEAYLRHLELTKRELEIPVMGSLNGSSPGGWVRHARLIEDAGADALELNV